MQQFPEDSWLQLGTCFGDRALPDAARRIGVELLEERLGLAPNAAEHKAGEEGDKAGKRELGGAVELGGINAKSVSEPLAIYDVASIFKQVVIGIYPAPSCCQSAFPVFRSFSLPFPCFGFHSFQATQDELPHSVSIGSIS
jgi:hypothetical protein